jgi:hypothetical protein
MLYLCCVGSVYCTNDISNPTPVYVVQGGEAVLQCGFESNRLSWRVYSGDDANLVAIDGSKYSVSNNPSTGLNYRLHILNVGVSDLKKYRCSGLDNGVYRAFYLKLDILGRCTDMLVTSKVENKFYFRWEYNLYVSNRKSSYDINDVMLFIC